MEEDDICYNTESTKFPFGGKMTETELETSCSEMVSDETEERKLAYNEVN